MDTAKIRQYAEILKEMDLTALELRDDGTVRLERESSLKKKAAETEIQNQTLIVSGESVQPAPTVKADSTEGSVMTSPMVGVFYAAPEENAEPLVRVGSKVHEGDVLCVIEAMKLMNEITAEADGVIEEILAVNGAVVEFGQPLFRLRKE